jgi:hypothetical protein
MSEATKRDFFLDPSDSGRASESKRSSKHFVSLADPRQTALFYGDEASSGMSSSRTVILFPGRSIEGEREGEQK